MFDQRIAWMGRGQPVVRADPVLGRQVFQIDPDRGLATGRTVRHGGNIGGRRITGEGFDHDIGHIRCAERPGRIGPWVDVDRMIVGFRTHERVQDLGLIDPQGDTFAALGKI